MLNLKERMARAPTIAPATPTVVAPVAQTTTPAAVNPPEGRTALQRLKAQQVAKAGQLPLATPVAAVAVPAPAPVAAVAVPVAAQAKSAPVAKPAKKQAAPTGRTLYVGCAPSTPYTPFAEIAQKVIDTLKGEHGGVHYRLIEGLFGGGPALFADAVGLYLDIEPGQSAGDIVVDLNTQEGTDALQALLTRSVNVVRAF